MGLAVLFRSAAWQCGLRPQEAEHLNSLERDCSWIRGCHAHCKGFRARHFGEPWWAGVQGLGLPLWVWGLLARVWGGQHETGHLTLGSEAGLAFWSIS